MKKIKFAVFAIVFSTLSCYACTEEGPRQPAEQPETPVEKPETPPDTPPEATTIQMTTAVPEAYFRAAEQQGIVEVVEYESRLHRFDGSHDQARLCVSALRI